MSSKVARLERLEQSLPEGPDTPCIFYTTKADGSNDAEMRTAAEKDWMGKTGRTIDPSNVRYVVARIMLTHEDVERYGNGP